MPGGAEGYHLGDLDKVECFSSAGNLEDCPLGIFIDWSPTGKWTAGVTRNTTYAVSLTASLVGARHASAYDLALVSQNFLRLSAHPFALFLRFKSPAPLFRSGTSLFMFKS